MRKYWGIRPWDEVSELMRYRLKDQSDERTGPDGELRHDFGPCSTLGKHGRRQLGDIQDQVDSLEEGEFADIVAVPGDPMCDITQIEHLDSGMKGGRVFKIVDEWPVIFAKPYSGSPLVRR